MAMAEQLLPLIRDADFRIDLDEVVPLTTLRYLGKGSSIQSAGVTATHYLQGDFCAPHPITWSDLDTDISTTFYKRPMSLRKLLQLHHRVQQQRPSTFIFLRKVHVQHAAEAKQLLQILKGMWAG
uniref:Uncharacterized protein n=1 Tax=Tetradesmus obliquus TaxID=3088 RepID=A0A383VKC5_TETOB